MCTPVSRTIKVYKIGANINRKYLKRFKHRSVNESYQIAIHLHFYDSTQHNIIK